MKLVLGILVYDFLSFLSEKRTIKLIVGIDMSHTINKLHGQNFESFFSEKPKA